ncbi:hypothetical protein GCM10009616_40150 [Microlunatus lacustris]
MAVLPHLILRRPGLIRPDQRSTVFHQPDHTQPFAGVDLALSRAAAERHQILQALTASRPSVPRRRAASSSRLVHRLRATALAWTDRFRAVTTTPARGRYFERTEQERPAR